MDLAAPVLDDRRVPNTLRPLGASKLVQPDQVDDPAGSLSAYRFPLPTANSQELPFLALRLGGYPERAPPKFVRLPQPVAGHSPNPGDMGQADSVLPSVNLT